MDAPVSWQDPLEAAFKKLFHRPCLTDSDGHIPLILQKGMDGFEVGRSYETMGSKGTTCALSTSEACACRRRTCWGSRATAIGWPWRSSTTAASQTNSLPATFTIAVSSE